MQIKRFLLLGILVCVFLPGFASETGPTGPLDGKVVYVNAGHGWSWNDGLEIWQTARGNTHSLVEDFLTAATVNQFLVPYLVNAGAEVRSPRELDMNTAMVIVDNADVSYVESGDPGLFGNAGGDGFNNFQAPYAFGTNPFRDTGGGARTMEISPTPTASVSWTPEVPNSGFYQVYISFQADPADGVDDAHYVVQHSGGETHVRLSQKHHGWTWVRLGRFHFEAGFDPAHGSVVLHNDSAATAGAVLSADAVRFGGGMGDVLRSTATSGRPRWEESAQAYAQYMGAPLEIYEGSFVSAVSRFAAWDNQPGEDSVFISIHTNAPDPGRGTTSFIYKPEPYDPGCEPDGAAVAGSAEMMNLVHAEVINDIRDGWDPNWTDRGCNGFYAGELNPAHNPEMPSGIVSLAFHETELDADQLKEPKFLRLVSRAISQGIVKYFADREGGAVNLLPDPPLNPEVHSTSQGAVRISWQAPVGDSDLSGDPAQSYLVFLSANGYGFGAGMETSDTHFDILGLDPEQIYYLQVRAVNEGGWSLPTETLAFRTLGPGSRRALLVQGFDRLDRHQLPSDDLSTYGLGSVSRMLPDRMNRFSYVIEHAEALRSYPVAFDSSSNEVVASGDVTLDPVIHQAVIWIAGDESTADETLSDQEQAVISAYLASGGDLMISGSEIAWDLDNRGNASDQAFIHEQLKASYDVDDAGVYLVTPAAGSIFDGLGLIGFDNGDGNTYDVRYPDGLTPQPDATGCLTYQGTPYSACVLSVNVNQDLSEGGDSKVVFMGFPFETIVSKSDREKLMGRTFNFLDIRPDKVFADGFEPK